MWGISTNIGLLAQVVVAGLAAAAFALVWLFLVLSLDAVTLP